jgi:hypothetical protein
VAYADKFDREVELVDITEAQELVVKIIAKEGELKFRDAFIESLESEVTVADEAEKNQDWLDGVGYCIHLARNGDFGVNERGA